MEELINWIDSHKLVKFVEEGRDFDMDQIIENQSSTDQQQQTKDEPPKSEN